MGSAGEEGAILVTGASGHIGREVCRVLREAKRQILPVLTRIQQSMPYPVISDQRVMYREYSKPASFEL